VEMKNRVKNFTMDEANKTALAYLLETSMWRLIRLIEKPVVEPQNEFAVARLPNSLILQWSTGASEACIQLDI